MKCKSGSVLKQRAKRHNRKSRIIENSQERRSPPKLRRIFIFGIARLEISKKREMSASRTSRRKGECIRI